MRTASALGIICEREPTMKTLMKELETYERNKQTLLAEHEGKFVVIHSDEVAGTWDSYSDAYAAGCDRFGLEPFLVKQVLAKDKVLVVTRNVVPCAF
jgi:hypothetical protein